LVKNLPGSLEEENKKLVQISKAALILGVSIDTLRRWDKNGKLKAIRRKEGGYRYYPKETVELYLKDIFAIAKKWASNLPVLPEPEYYCPDSLVFKMRLGRLEKDLSKIERWCNDFSYYFLIGKFLKEIAKRQEAAAADLEAKKLMLELTGVNASSLTGITSMISHPCKAIGASSGTLTTSLLPGANGKAICSAIFVICATTCSAIWPGIWAICSTIETGGVSGVGVWVTGAGAGALVLPELTLVPDIPPVHIKVKSSVAELPAVSVTVSLIT